MTIDDLNAWVDGEPEPEQPTPKLVVYPPRKLKGTWRRKGMRADRRPLYVHPHDERHLWLTPRSMKRRRRIGRR